MLTNDKRAPQPKTPGKAVFSWRLFWKDRIDVQGPRKVDALALVRDLRQVFSVAAFIGSVVQTETRKNYQVRSSEPFSAVGQWGSVAAVRLVLTAAVITKVCQKPEHAKYAIHATESDPDADEEKANVEWNHKVGYAS